MKSAKLAMVLIGLAGMCAPSAAQKRPEPGAPNGHPDRFAWWREAKFGMFIHWGPYSVAGVEASWPIMEPDPKKWPITEAEYRALPQRFNPVRFDPKAWVLLAREAGQRYMVFTTKHHDGFCMFNSAYTNYKITNTPYKKDIVAELAAACKSEGMPLGFYYSPPDMNHPAYRDTSKPASTNWQSEPNRPEYPLYLDYMELQLTELFTRYGDVAEIWFDGGCCSFFPGLGHRYHDLARRFQPAILINDRMGRLPGDFSTPEQTAFKAIPTKKFPDYQPPDPAAVPSPEDFRPWETCMTINETWGYNRNDRNFKSTAQLIRVLVDVASRGGNYLLNVGPMPDGTIQPEFEERLRGIGAWLRINGESIYGTTYGPLQALSFARTTQKRNTIYLHVFEWPKGKLELTGLRARVSSVSLLAGGKPLPFSQKGNRLSIQVPAQAPDSVVTVLALKTR